MAHVVCMEFIRGLIGHPYMDSFMAPTTGKGENIWNHYIAWHILFGVYYYYYYYYLTPKLG
jgi:hypothetical protein